MDIKTAEKAKKLLEHKEEIEHFFDNIKNIPDIQKIVVSIEGVYYKSAEPCVALLSPEIVLPCLKEELEAVKRGIDNL